MNSLYAGRPFRYAQLDVLIAIFKPKTIIEVGTNFGASAESMCLEALRHQAEVHYVGYDVFDTESDAFHREALNRKRFTTEHDVSNRLKGIQKNHKGFSFELIVGRTSETLHGRSIAADFVFIDGDHRADVIEKDFFALCQSRLIVFDDYYPSDIVDKETECVYGCRRIVDRLDGATLLPVTDFFDNIGEVRLAYIHQPSNSGGTDYRPDLPIA